MAIAKAIIKCQNEIASPVEYHENLDLELHGWKDFEEQVELEIIAYVNKDLIPLWCIEGKPLKVYSENDLTNRFFEALLNHGEKKGNTGLLVRCHGVDNRLLVYTDITNSPRVFAIFINIGVSADLSSALNYVKKEENLRVLQKNNESYFIPVEDTEPDGQVIKQEATTPEIRSFSNTSFTTSKSSNALDSLVQRRSSTPFERAARQQSIGKGDIYRMPSMNIKNSMSSSIKQELPDSSIASRDLSHDESERNRQLFKQVILASFRLRGLSPNNYADYRALYHHTHRSLVFAFRNILSGRMELGQVQDKVDALLSVYLD